MAFGVKRSEIDSWKREVSKGNIAFLTHYWADERFPHCRTVTKAGCSDMEKLIEWGKKHGLQPEWIDKRNPDRPHFDLLGDKQLAVLQKEGLQDHIERFCLLKN